MTHHHLKFFALFRQTHTFFISHPRPLPPPPPPPPPSPSGVLVRCVKMKVEPAEGVSIVGGREHDETLCLEFVAIFSEKIS